MIQPIDYFLVCWFVLAGLSTAYVAYDQVVNNPEPTAMKWGFIPRHTLHGTARPLGLTVTEAAKALGIARHTLSSVLNGHAGISADMAIRFEKSGWSNADPWLRLQVAYDLAQARKHERNIKVKLFTDLVHI